MSPVTPLRELIRVYGAPRVLHCLALALETDGHEAASLTVDELHRAGRRESRRISSNPRTHPHDA